MAVSSELIRQLAVIAQGRNPAWTRQTAFASIPAPGTNGVELDGAIVSCVLVQLRARPDRHASRLYVDTLDLAATYTATIDGNAVAYDAASEAPANLAELLEGVATAINADLTVGALVTATAVDLDGDGALDAVEVVNDTVGATTHTTAWSAGGSAVVSFDEDATAADLDLYVTPDTTGDTLAPSPGWALGNGASYTIPQGGFFERFETSGVAALYARLSSITSPTPGATVRPLVWIGPALLEE